MATASASAPSAVHAAPVVLFAAALLAAADLWPTEAQATQEQD